MKMPPPTLIEPAVARDFLVGHLGLRRRRSEAGAAGVRATLHALRCIQLDPLDRVGTNADLVVHARVPGLRRGDVYRHLLPGHAFEHFAKERCLLPASAAPWYAGGLAEPRRWWRWRAIPRPAEALLTSVLDEVRAAGPRRVDQLQDRGPASPKVSLNTVAVAQLFDQARLLPVGRHAKGKVYDLPTRAFPESFPGAFPGAPAPPAGEFAEWALVERVAAAGLMPVNAAPQWGLLRAERTGDLPARLVRAGALSHVQIQGDRRRYLAPGDFAAATFPEDDGEMRVLAPLDPLVWDRPLLRHAFGFDYVWEVYKPAAQRRWGYYVCPLLHRGALVGRFEGRRTEAGLEVTDLWPEPGHHFDPVAWDRARARLAAFQ